MEIAGFEINDTVDITDKVCPLTFVKAKVAIEELEDGEILAIHLKEEGHKVLKMIDNEDGTFELIVQKVEA